MDVTTVCNMALGHVGADAISDIDNSRSTNAEYCNTYYATARDATLEGHDWNFARLRRSLALLDEAAPDDWSYVYAYPADCVKFRRLLHPNRRTNSPYPFEIGLRSDKSSTCIFTDVNPISGVYTARITDLNLYSSLAIEALSWKLASLVVVPITRKLDAPKEYLQVFYAKLSEAEAASSNEGQRDDIPDSTLLSARY